MPHRNFILNLLIIIVSNIYSQDNILKGEFTKYESNECFSNFFFVGTIDDINYNVITDCKDKDNLKYLWQLIDRQSGEVIKTLPFIFPAMPGVSGKSYQYSGRPIIVKGKIIAHFTYEGNQENHKLYAACFIDPETLIPESTTATFLCSFPELSNYKVLKSGPQLNIKSRIVINSDSSHILIISDSYNIIVGDNDKDSHQTEISVSVKTFSTDDLTPGAEANFKSNIAFMFYELPTINLLTSGKFVFVFNRKKKYYSDFEYLSSKRVLQELSEEGLVDQYICSGRDKEGFNKTEVKFFKKNRQVVSLSSNFSGDTILCVEIFRDIVFEGKKIRYLKPGLRIMKYGAVDLVEKGDQELVLTESQTALCTPQYKKVDLFLLTYITCRYEVVKIFSSSGSLTVHCKASAFEGFIEYAYPPIVASFDFNDLQNSWIRIIASRKITPRGCETSIFSDNGNIYWVSNDVASNISNLDNLKNYMDNAPKNTSQVPEKNDLLKIDEFKMTSLDYVLRIDKIDKNGKMDSYFIKEFHNSKYYLPAPSDVWINEYGEFFVHGVGEFDSFTFKKHNFMKVKLP